MSNRAGNRLAIRLDPTHILSFLGKKFFLYIFLFLFILSAKMDQMKTKLRSAKVKNRQFPAKFSKKGLNFFLHTDVFHYYYS